MLRLAVLFLIIALLSAFFGFGLLASMAFEAAKILFFIFLILAVVALLLGCRRRIPFD